jgi:hypothetical protein
VPIAHVPRACLLQAIAKQQQSQAVELHRCDACQKELPKDCYTKTGWSKRNTKALTCKLCEVRAARVPFVCFFSACVLRARSWIALV